MYYSDCNLLSLTQTTNEIIRVLLQNSITIGKCDNKNTNGLNIMPKYVKACCQNIDFVI